MQIVNPCSAALQGFHSLSIRGTHHGVARFRRDGDNGFARASNQLSQWAISIAKDYRDTNQSNATGGQPAGSSTSHTSKTSAKPASKVERQSHQQSKQTTKGGKDSKMQRNLKSSTSQPIANLTQYNYNIYCIDKGSGKTQANATSETKSSHPSTSKPKESQVSKAGLQPPWLNVIPDLSQMIGNLFQVFPQLCVDGSMAGPTAPPTKNLSPRSIADPQLNTRLREMSLRPEEDDTTDDSEEEFEEEDDKNEDDESEGENEDPPPAYTASDALRAARAQGSSRNR